MMNPLLVCVLALTMLTGLQPLVAAQEMPDEEGFVAIFNGRDLTGWDGDPRFWSVKDGAIRGETSAENPAPHNTFCIWRGGTLRDFILKIKFRIQNGNSGIQYRSVEFDKWRVGGYQAEVENSPDKVGFLYHEAGRGWLVNVGDFMVIDSQGHKSVVGKVAEVEALKQTGYYKPQDWNEYLIIAQGNYLRHYLNGYPTMALIDEDRVTDSADPTDRNGAQREGLLALQIHTGPPMVVEFKDIRLKHLTSNYGQAIRLFNGENLEGWVPMNEGNASTFAVANGVITDSGQPAGYLRTTTDYTNYTLHLQMRHLAEGNSGVLVRMVGEDKVWPKSIEAQGQSGAMGDIWNIDEVRMKVDPDRTEGRHTRKLHPSNERPLGEWNDYEILLDGGRLEIRVNNLLQNMATDCEEVPGKICLQAEGSPKEFRNIVLVPIER
ncbi:MAG: 3-keto-disaccharide hydrolase [Candidatus Zipacnadales bacterium]